MIGARTRWRRSCIHCKNEQSWLLDMGRVTSLVTLKSFNESARCIGAKGYLVPVPGHPWLVSISRPQVEAVDQRLAKPIHKAICERPGTRCDHVRRSLMHRIMAIAQQVMCFAR